MDPAAVVVFVEIPAGSRNKYMTDEKSSDYKQLERKKTATRGFGNRAEALEVIEAARVRAG